MRVVPIAAALWAAHALAQSPAPAAPTPAPAPAPAASAPAPSTSPQATASPAPAPAPETSSYSAPAPAPVTPAAPAEQPTQWGVLLDGGVPDGVGASAVFRPMNWLRLSAGGAYNFVAFGFRGGVSVVPFYFPFSPSLNVDVGHFLGGDATPILTTAFQGSGITVPTDSPLLKQVAYDYANVHLGLEFGLPRTFTIFLRLGISYIRTVLHGFQQLVQEAAGTPTNPDTTITAQDPTIILTAPSLKLGLIVYF